MPKLRSLFTQLPLRYSVPFAVLGLALLVGVSALFFNLKLATRQLDRTAISSLQREAAVLQYSLQYLLAHNDLDEVQHQMVQRHADPKVETAFVTNEHGIITAAGAPSELGRTLEWRLSLLRDADQSFDPAVPLKLVGTRGDVLLSPNGHWAIALYPVALNEPPPNLAAPGEQAGQEKIERSGTLVLVRELATYKATARGEVLRSFISYALLSVVCAAALALLIYLTVTRRAMQLTRAAGRFAAGDAQARADLTGGDELAVAGRAFDAMAVQVSTAQLDRVESEGRFRLLADAAPVMIWVTGPDGSCTYVNEAWLKFRGRPLEQELGRGWIEGVPPEDMEKDLADLFAPDARTEAFDAGVPPDSSRWRDSRHREPDGPALLGRWQVHRLHRRRHRHYRAQSCGKCLAREPRTAGRNSEYGAGQRHCSRRAVQYHAVQPCCWHHVSAQCCRGAGLPVRHAVAERFRDSHGEHLRRFAITDEARRAMDAPGPLFGLRANGEEFPIEASISQASIGTRRFHTVIVRDISERVMAEAQRARLEERLRHAQKMEAVGTLAGGIAHDFNNIMAAILGNADLARHELPATHPAQASIAEITTATRRGKEMVTGCSLSAGRMHRNVSHWRCNQLPRRRCG